MNLLLLLLSFNWFMDYPIFSDPLIAKCGVVGDLGTIKSDLLLRYTRSESAETYLLPYYISIVPLDKFRFGTRIPFIWQYPKATEKRVGIGDIALEGTYHLYSVFGDFLSVGSELAFPTTADTLKPKDDKVKLMPYIADVYVWNFLALFFDFGVTVPVYDFKARKFDLHPEGTIYHVAARAWPIQLVALGIEYQNNPAAFIPNVAFYLNDTWNVNLGLVLPVSADSVRTIVAGIRFKL
jgi:hypothetical protein